MEWHQALNTSELTSGKRKCVTVAGNKIILINHQDKVHAIESACPHFRLPLAKATITDDNAIVCPWHKSAFDLTSGDVKDWSPWPPVVGKLLGKLSRKKTLKVFNTKVENEQVWVEI